MPVDRRAIQIDHTVTGTDDVVAVLNGLLDEFGPKDARGVLRRALRMTAQPLYDLVYNTTPVDTGRLRERTRIRALTVQGIPTVNVGWRSTSRRDGSPPPKLRTVEFGNVSLGREPTYTLTRAYMQEDAGLRSRFAGHLREAIEHRVGLLRRRAERNRRSGEPGPSRR